MTTSKTNDISCKKYRPTHEYSHVQEFIDNLPYILMTIIGAIILILGFELTLWGWVVGGLYIIYSIIGTFCIILFVCPYCLYYDTRSCPCGYGQIAAKLCSGKSEDRFMVKFKQYIPIIVPLWIIPLVAGIIFLIQSFSFWMLFLIVVFILDSFIILPLISRKYGCAHCPQRDTCPWMK